MSSNDSAECCDEGLPMTLPPNWPTVPQRSGLQDSGWSMKSLTYSIRRKNRIGTDRDAALFGVLHQRRRSPLMLHPDSWFCTALEGAAVVVLVVELCLMPFTLAFDVPMEGSVLAAVWIMVCFWTVDFLLGVNTGVWTGDGLELRRSFVQRHRFRGWASFDLCLLALDWTSLFLTESESSSGRVLRMAKVSKLLRATMLLRMVRLAQLLEKWLDRFGFGDMTALLKIIGLSLSALWLSHVFACIWYAVGKAGEESWLDMFFSDDTRYRELGTVSIYCTSFHWAITQMTLGSVDVYAINSQERLLSICVMIFGLLFTSTLVSSVSASLVGSQMLAGHRAQQAHNLEVFLRQNKVTSTLACQVMKIANSTLCRSDKLLESDVGGLESVAEVPQAAASIRCLQTDP